MALHSGCPSTFIVRGLTTGVTVSPALIDFFDASGRAPLSLRFEAVRPGAGKENQEPEGEQGGAGSIETYILVANPGTTAASLRVTLYFENGTTSERTFSVGGNSRFNVNVGAHFAEASGKRFGAIVESLDDVPIIVERAMYSNADGVVWAAGTNAVATRLK